MPNPINGLVLSSDQYTDAATISGVYGGRGGAFAITNGNVYAEIQYSEGGNQGTETWAPERLFNPGGGTIDPGAIGVRFRNADNTLPGTVSASITPPGYPGMSQNYAGALSGTMVGGIVSSTGTIIGGSGFTVAHPSTGVYTVTFTTAFGAQPVVLVTAFSAFVELVLASTSASQFQINTLNPSGTLINAAFNFQANQVV